MDTENHFSLMEESIGYEYILKIIKDARAIDNYENKVKISALLFYHPYRSYRYLLNLYEKYSDYENFRFWALYEWKYLMDKLSHTLKITKILEGKWTIYSLQNFYFPICDNPVLNVDKTLQSSLVYPVNKASTVQSIEIKPEFVLFGNPAFKRNDRNVFVFRKFSFPSHKVLKIGLSEKQISGRTLELKLRYQDVLDADVL